MPYRRDETYVSKEQGSRYQMVNAVMVSLLALVMREEQLHMMGRDFDRYRGDDWQESHPESAQIIDADTRDELIELARLGLQAKITEKRERLGRAIVDAARCGVTKFDFSVSPDFMYPNFRDEYERRVASEEVSLPHAQILDIIKDMRERVSKDLEYGLKKDGSRAHSVIRLQGANNALNAIEMMLEQVGLR